MFTQRIGYLKQKIFFTGFIFASLIEYALVNYIYHKDKRRRKKANGMKRVESTATFCSMDSELSSSTFRIFAKKVGIRLKALLLVNYFIFDLILFILDQQNNRSHDIKIQLILV